MVDRYQVSDGGNALKVIVPSFSLKGIGQSTPVSGASNTLSITLRCDTGRIPGGSIITITGLTGSQTSTSSSLCLDLTPNDGSILSTGDWNIDGTLKLTVAGSGLVSASTYIAAINLTNPAETQSSPPVSVEVAVKDGSTVLGSIAQTAMTKAGVALYGVDDGKSPLRVLVPAFNFKTMQQSNPLTDVSNTFSLKLIANYDFGNGSKITVAGLKQTQTTGSTVPLISTSSAFGNIGSWDQTSGALILTASDGGLSSGTIYEVKFDLRNPAYGQSEPVVTIEGVGSGLAPFVIQTIDSTPNTPLMGFVNGTNTLLIVAPRFTMLSIRQSNPASDALINTLIVSIMTNCHLSAGSSIVISGLTGVFFKESARLAMSYSDVASYCET